MSKVRMTVKLTYSQRICQLGNLTARVPSEVPPSFVFLDKTSALLC